MLKNIFSKTTSAICLVGVPFFCYSPSSLEPAAEFIAVSFSSFAVSILEAVYYA